MPTVKKSTKPKAKAAEVAAYLRNALKGTP